jgi:hypothetical protein
VRDILALAQQVGPGGTNPDPVIVAHFAKGKKTGVEGLHQLLQDSVNRHMAVN